MGKSMQTLVTTFQGMKQQHDIMEKREKDREESLRARDQTIKSLGACLSRVPCDHITTCHVYHVPMLYIFALLCTAVVVMSV